MGVMRPGSYSHADPRQNPEDWKRLRSGFWTRQYDMATQVETWTCDKGKLNEEVARAMLDPDFSEKFHRQGIHILDRLWGRGTAEAFSHSGKGMVQMRIPDFVKEQYPVRNDREDAMAYYLWNTTDTTASTTSTITTSGSNVIMNNRPTMDEVRFSNKAKYRPTKRLVNKFPFRPEAGDAKNLLSSLQREFDWWAGKTREELFG